MGPEGKARLQHAWGTAVGERFGISPASNWTASVAGGAEFSFISPKIKYHGLPFFFF